MLSLIVAIAKNGVIGSQNKMPWRLPEDLKHVKDITDGKTLIMGKNTFLSLPKVLPNRKHVVLTRDKSFQPIESNVFAIADLKEAIAPYLPQNTPEAFVFGGATIYEQILPFCQKMYITDILQDFEGDTVFPPVNWDEWALKEKSLPIIDKNSGVGFVYTTWERI